MPLENEADNVRVNDSLVALGGDVNVALLIDEANEGFGFLRWSGVDMAQQTIQRE